MPIWKITHMQICMYVYAYIASAYMADHAYAGMYVCMDIYMYIYIHTHTHTHIYTHTNARTQVRGELFVGVAVEDGRKESL